MANNDNLKRGNPETQFKSGREAAEAGRKGGIAAGAARRRKRDIRKSLEDRVFDTYTDKSGNKLEGIDVLAATLFKIATDPSHKQVITAQRLIFEMLGMDQTAADKKRIKQALKLQAQEIELNQKRIDADQEDWTTDISGE